MKVVTCIVARTTSNRLPLKVLRAVNKEKTLSILDVIIQKAKLSQLTDSIYLCTSTEACDDVLEDTAIRNGINFYRGAANEVIERLVSVADIEDADYIVRVTGDNVFVACEYLDEQIQMCVEHELDYCRLSGVPIGATAEVIKVTALKKLYQEMDLSVSEYLMLYIFDPSKFKCGVLKSEEYMGNYGITVDTYEDLDNVFKIVDELGDSAESLSLSNICKLFTDCKDIFKEISPEAVVKLPYEETISFGEFMKQQQQRIETSQCIKQFSIYQ